MLSPDRPPAHMDQASMQNPARDGLTPTQSLPPPQDGQVLTMHAKERCLSCTAAIALHSRPLWGRFRDPDNSYHLGMSLQALSLEVLLTQLLKAPSSWAAAGPAQRIGPRAECVRARAFSNRRSGAYSQLPQQNISPDAGQDAASAMARAGHTISANHPTDQPSPP